VTRHGQRNGDRDVEVSVPGVERWRANTPVSVDDIVSTVHTLIEIINHLARAGMRSPTCIAVHGLFAGNAYPELLAAAAGQIVTTDTIPHKSNAINISGLLAEGIKKIRVGPRQCGRSLIFNPRKVRCHMRHAFKIAVVFLVSLLWNAPVFAQAYGDRDV